GRDHEEREAMVFQPAVQQLHQQRDVLAQPHAAPRLHEVLAAHAPELRVVANEVGQLSALLHEVARGEAGDLLLERGGADDLAQDDTRVVEAERLVEVRRHQEVLAGGGRGAGHVTSVWAMLTYQLASYNVGPSGSPVKSPFCRSGCNSAATAFCKRNKPVISFVHAQGRHRRSAEIPAGL